VRGLLSAALRHRPIAERPDRAGPALNSDEEPGSVVRAFADDLEAIPGAAYHMDCFEVNAVNYGAPQLRERAFFIGNRFGLQVDFPNPTHGPPSEDPSQPSLFSARDTELQPWATLGNALAGLEDEKPIVMDFSPRKKSFLAMIPPGSNWRSLPIAVQQESMGKAWYAKGGRSGWWRRLTFDLPCPTLVTMPNHASTALCHPTETRALTLREYTRVQQFPDDWKVCGSAAQQYAQIGNAVPVRLGRVAGQVIAGSLERVDKLGNVPVAPPAAYRVIYIQSHVRTRQWFKDGETLIWRDGDESANPTYAPPKTRRKSRAL
jgi:DNA (cytosine-5)-methyltransferase 1